MKTNELRHYCLMKFRPMLEELAETVRASTPDAHFRTTDVPLEDYPLALYANFVKRAAAPDSDNVEISFICSNQPDSVACYCEVNTDKIEFLAEGPKVKIPVTSDGNLDQSRIDNWAREVDDFLLTCRELIVRELSGSR